MLIMRKLLVFACGMAMLFGIQVASASDLKVGVVDLKKVLTEAPQVAKMRADLQKQFEPKNKELGDMQKKLQADMDKYNKESPVMKDKEKKELQDSIVEQQNKFREKQGEFQKSLMEAENKSMQTMSDLVQGIVDKMAKDQKLNLVIAKGALAYSDSSLEITDKVIKELKDKK